MAPATAIYPKSQRVAMKTLVSVAVYGLLPVPLPPERLKEACDDLMKTALTGDARPVTERLVTPDELARIHDEIDKIERKQ